MGPPRSLIPSAALEAFRTRLNGSVLTPRDDEYDEARQLFNSRHDKRPAVIAQCVGTDDVVEAIRFARANSLEIAVRSGGRHAAGFGSSEGGLVVDLSAMRAVRVDPREGVAWVQAGARGIDLQAEAQVHGLAGITGVLTHTGIGGVNLHGGLGWLSGRLGWGVDTILEAEIVTADGEVLRAAPDERPDLFWAIRGAGSNFGVVTWLKMRLHPIPREVLAGPLLYHRDRAAEVLRFLRRFTEETSDDWFFFVEFLTAGDDPELPAGLRAAPVVMVNLLHFGETELAGREVGALRDGLPPDVDRVRARGLVEFTRSISGTYPRMRQWWDEEQLAELGDEAIELLVGQARELEEAHLSSLSCLMVYPFRGALGREPEWPNAIGRSRHNGWSVGSMLFWEEEADDARHEDWSDRLLGRLRRADLTTGAVYPNVQQRPDEDRQRRSLGEETWSRLRAVKATYDPDNVFRLNHNVPPR